MPCKVACLLVAALCFSSCIPSSVHAQTADTVVGFEDLSQDAIVVSQYRNLGVVFGPNSVLPHAVKVGPGIAQSGSTVVSISCDPNCPQEFPDSRTRLSYARANFNCVRKNTIRSKDYSQ